MQQILENNDVNTSVQQEGYPDPEPVRDRWQQHLRGTENWAYPLWNVLLFQAWKERWL